jgi:chromosome partitioning protein
LTLLDLSDLGDVGLGHIAARQELREMIAGLAIPGRDEINDQPRAVAAG